MYLKLRILNLLLIAGLLSLPALSQKVFYVTPTGSGANNGSSWDNAYTGTQLQVAINAAGTYWQAKQNDTVQVWVAAGVYKRTTGSDRSISFTMRDHVGIYGGFVGTETTLNQRPPITHSLPSSTTLSGDIGEPGNWNDNSYHVIYNNITLGESAILDGFVVSGGYSDIEFGYGGGIYNGGKSCQPVIRNCSFRENRATLGGGMANYDASPKVSNCSFIDNSVQHSTFFPMGGGAYVRSTQDGLSPFVNCLFQGNSGGSRSSGGALYVDALNLSDETHPISINCTFVNNSAAGGGAIGAGLIDGTLRATNSLFWGNGRANTIQYFTLAATNCMFEESVSGYSGDGNLTAITRPFASETNPQLTFCSPAVNAGDPNSATATSGTTDLDGKPRFVGGRIDIGAFEFQGELTITQPPVSASTVCARSAITVPVAATSNTTIAYQWFKDNSLLTPAQTTATLSFTSVQTQDAGSYVLVLTTDCESLTTTAFQLTVNATPAPVLSLSPATPQPILQNTPAVSLTVTGCAGGTVSWQGPNSTSGTGTAISMPTSTTGTLVYAATCTLNSCVSPAGSFTVSIIPAPISGNFDGYIYGADCGTFRGWTWDRGKPNTVQSVDILDGATFIETIPANEFRQDLKDAGKGNGIHAFRWSIPESLKDGQVHYLSARVAGSSFFLKDSPKALVCAGGTTSPPNKQPVAPTMTPLTAQEGVVFSTTLPVFTDPEGSPLSYGLVSLPTGLSFTAASRLLSGTPSQSGVFVLTYSATDGQGATNSVSFNLTVNPAASTPVTGSFEGYLDKVECGTIRGWVWDRNKPNTPVSVEFYTGSTVWGSTVANIYRVDLLNAGKGNGVHAYSFEVPAVLKDGVTRSIRARVLGSTYDLKDSGKPLTCGSPARLSAEAGSELQVKVLGNPVLDELMVEIRGAEGQPLRVQLSDISGRLVGQYQIETAKPVEQPTFSVREQRAGVYLLRVSSGLKSVTVKVVKQ